MSIRYGQICPVSKTAELLGERWTLLIVRELVLGTTRFNDFHRALSQISPSLLTKRLKELEEAGLVIRKTIPNQRRTEYFPTAACKELKPIILGLGKWGMRWARGQMNDDELDVEMLDVRFAAADRRGPAARRTHRHQVCVSCAPEVWAVVDRDRTGWSSGIVRAQSASSGRHRINHRPANDEPRLGRGHGSANGEGCSATGVERKSDFNPNNLIMAPTRNVCSHSTSSRRAENLKR